jgi:4-hydroxy-2-oxoglutarate aldolase
MIAECCADPYNALALNQTRHNTNHNPLIRGEAPGALLLPLTTPFDGSGAADVGTLRANIGKWNATGVSGYVLLGSTGERVHLDEREYFEVIQAARAAVPTGTDGLAFIVGAGQQSTRGTINEIGKAAEAGADAVLVITPCFYRPAITQEALITYYTAVADAAPVPMMLYSMPALTGVKIEPETIARLSGHPNIIGVKDSSADIEGLKETIRLVRGDAASKGPAPLDDSSNRPVEPDRKSAKRSPKDFAILTGNGTVFCAALCAGADAGILAVGCVAPRLCLEIFCAVQAGEPERAAALQEKLTPLARAVTTTYGIGGLKAALDMIGYTGGAVRAPLRSPDEAARREIAQVLSDANAVLTAAHSH